MPSMTVEETRIFGCPSCGKMICFARDVGSGEIMGLHELPACAHFSQAESLRGMMGDANYAEFGKDWPERPDYPARVAQAKTAALQMLSLADELTLPGSQLMRRMSNMHREAVDKWPDAYLMMQPPASKTNQQLIAILAEHGLRVEGTLVVDDV